MRKDIRSDREKRQRTGFPWMSKEDAFEMKEKKRLTPEEELRIDRRIQISVIIIAGIMLL